MSEPHVSTARKLRAMLPEAVCVATAVAAETAARAVGSAALSFVPFVTIAAGAAVVCLALLIGKATSIGITRTWEDYLPPPREKACKKCMALEKDNAELRHALAVLGPLSEERER